MLTKILKPLLKNRKCKKVIRDGAWGSAHYIAVSFIIKLYKEAIAQR